MPFLALIDEVESLKRKNPDLLKEHPKAKLLARLTKLITEEIPANPNAPEYQQGNTLGKSQRHWRRAKFLGRFRLFFRFSSSQKVIIYAWVNDEDTLRKAGSSTDPYEVFKKRLLAGDPPDSWEELLAASCKLESGS